MGGMNPRKHGREESKQVRIVSTEVELTGRERPKGREREKEGSKRSRERSLLRKHGDQLSRKAKLRPELRRQP